MNICISFSILVADFCTSKIGYDNAAKIVKSSPSQIVINPPPSFSPEVITADPVGDANLKVNNRSAPSQELPEFSAGKMRSMSKIKTLGIAV